MTQDKPSKLYHSISEVATQTGVKAHVLRYWETEFPTLRPKKTRSGSRRYRQLDIDEILAIKALLYDEGFKIAGARKVRRQAHSKQAQAEKPQLSLDFGQMDQSEQLKVVREELAEVLKLVKGLGKKAASGRG
ncbi:MerR family transcriptional regulator [bacterium]|nr:MerR family transcriptional regulator [bacterium]PJA75458.1 MAG: MerR family transcriptional regulator [bacterium CG_4_9_14_3_um_filter_65_15]